MSADSASSHTSSHRSSLTPHQFGGQVVLAGSGPDSPADSRTAEGWGAEYSRHRGLPAVLVGVFEADLTSAYADTLYVPDIADDASRRAMESRLTRRHAELLATHPGLDLMPLAMRGHIGAALVEASERAELVVLGTRGLDGWSGLLLGSTSHYVVTHARGPVAVVPSQLSDDLTADDPIVLGVDGGSDHAATRFAFDEARREHRPLIAVHSWVKDDHRHEGTPTEAHLDQVLHETLAPFIAEYTDVEVRTQVVHGESDLALLGASARAAMLVVGSRGRGEVRSVLFGSTSLRLLGRASCPAVVVPERSGVRPDPAASDPRS